METGQIVTIIITAALSVIGTLGVTYVNHRLALLKDREMRREELDKHARYLAIRVVCKLDPFISECCDVVSDDGLSDHEGITRPRVADPTISIPQDVDWRSIRPDLMYRILGLPNEIDVARHSIEFVATEIAGPPDHEEYFEERIIQYGQLGLAALALADEIRETYGIPQRNYANWRPKDLLGKALAETTRARDQSRAQQVASIEEATERPNTKAVEADQKQ